MLGGGIFALRRPRPYSQGIRAHSYSILINPLIPKPMRYLISSLVGLLVGLLLGWWLFRAPRPLYTITTRTDTLWRRDTVRVPTYIPRARAVPSVCSDAVSKYRTAVQKDRGAAQKDCVAIQTPAAQYAAMAALRSLPDTPVWVYDDARTDSLLYLRVLDSCSPRGIFARQLEYRILAPTAITTTEVRPAAPRWGWWGQVGYGLPMGAGRPCLQLSAGVRYRRATLGLGTDGRRLILVGGGAW